MENMPLCRHFKFVTQQGEGKSEPLDNTPSLSLYVYV
jgi:hypothetical protein